MIQDNDTTSNRIHLWAGLVLLTVACTLLLMVWTGRLALPNRNELALGKETDVMNVSIEIQPPVEFDTLAKTRILAMRKEAVNRHPELLASAYKPSGAVFGRIENKAPWWGTTGMFYFGRGERSIEGPAEESRFILNPFLLVAAELEGATIWRHGTAMWDQARAANVDPGAAGFPLYCPAQDLHWYPAQRRAQVTYDVSRYLKSVRSWTGEPLPLPIEFSLLAYNARDLNLNFAYIAFEDSRNVHQDDAADAPLPIRHYLHRGNSCGYPGGCNNASPRMPQISAIWIDKLPARVVVWLWRDEPRADGPEPDLVFTIWLE